MDSWEFRLLLCVLACYRLARMIAQDDGPLFLFKRIRYLAKDKAWHEAGEPMPFDNDTLNDRYFGHWHNLAEGLSCPYCVGVWLSIPLFIMWLYPNNLGDLILVLISISALQAFMQSLGK